MALESAASNLKIRSISLGIESLILIHKESDWIMMSPFHSDIENELMEKCVPREITLNSWCLPDLGSD